MRKYALVILDNTDTIIDRYAFDKVTDARGNGFSLDLSAISGDLEDLITKVRQKKNIISFVVQQIDESYQKANTLANWIQQYSTEEYTMCLEYDDGVSEKRYCVGKVTKLEKDEKTYPNVLQQRLEFTQTTPYFFKKENLLLIQSLNAGKTYPYVYPYVYQSATISNNEIKNLYFLGIPLIVILDGKIDNPSIELYKYTFDEDGNEVVEATNYSMVKFLENIEIAENEQLVINSAQKKIFKKVYADATKTKLLRTEDFSNMVDPQHDSYLIAEKGYTKLIVSQGGDGFKLVGNWRQYTL